MKTVFLDFDGVLFDTLKEAYILCRYAFNGTDYFTPINKDHYKKFYRYKFLVFNSWQYYYIMSLLKNELSDDEFIKEYKYLTTNRDYSAEEDFDKKYYSARKDLMENHNEFWNKLETPFNFFYRVKEETESGTIKPIIVSKKNKSAMMYRFNQYGFSIPERDIYGKDELCNYKTKAEFIEEFMRSNLIKNACFVDDNSNNFIGCNSAITTLLAGWGNIAINEVGLTEENVVRELI